MNNERVYDKADVYYMENADMLGTVKNGNHIRLPREIFNSAVEAIKQRKIRTIPDYLRSCGWWKKDQIASCLLKRGNDYVSLYEVQG